MRSLISWAPAVLIAAAIGFPFVTPDPFLTVFLTNTLLYAMLALGLQLTFGVAGMVILCQAAFYGVGAYAGALLAIHFQLPFPLTVLAGMLAAVLTGLVMAPIMKLKEVYFSMATFSFGAIATVLLRELPFTGGVNGLPGIPSAELFGFAFESSESRYFLVLAALALQYILFRRLLSSPVGLFLNAIRQNEPAARAAGMPVVTLQVKATSLAFAAAGAAGALMAHIQGFINPDMFGTSTSLWILGMVVVGGLQHMGGALTGAIALALVAEYSRGFKEYIQLAYGAMLVAFMTLIPNGLWSLVDRLVQRISPPKAHRRYVSEVPEAIRPAFETGQPEEPLLETRNVTRIFDGVVALNGANITVRRGEIHGLIGPNGAGKTSLLNVLSGFYRPSSGDVLWRGRPISASPDHARATMGIARTFQSPQICPELSVVENVVLGYYPRMRTTFWNTYISRRATQALFTEAAARARWALEYVGLQDLLQVEAGSLSYGQKKLLEIARALVTGPQLILLDEPAAGLTPVEVQAMGEVVKRIHQLGVTVLIIEHNMPLMMGLCHRMTVLHFGQVIADGTPGEIREEPQVVAAYLGG